MVEDVAGDHDDIDIFRGRDLSHLAEDLASLVDPRAPGECLSDVPVARV